MIARRTGSGRIVSNDLSSSALVLTVECERADRLTLNGYTNSAAADDRSLLAIACCSERNTLASARAGESAPASCAETRPDTTTKFRSVRASEKRRTSSVVDRGRTPYNARAHLRASQTKY